MTWPQCKALAQTGNIVCPQEGIPRMAVQEVRKDWWELGRYYECHNMITLTEVIYTRHNRPNNLLWRTPLGDWECCGIYSSFPPPEQIKKHWGEGRYAMRDHVEQNMHSHREIITDREHAQLKRLGILRRDDNSVTDREHLPRVYIAGPRTGYYKYNFPAFDKAASVLEEQGFDVVSPAQLDRDEGFDPDDLPDTHDWSDPWPGGEFSMEECITRDIDALRTCACIYMLPGWQISTGALAEACMAKWRGLVFMYHPDAVRTAELTLPE